MVKIYDTTLRDGAQFENINFSTNDKLLIARKLSEIGIPYIEGGWPGANPTDTEFFTKIKDFNLDAKIAAFCSTTRSGISPQKDNTLLLIKSLKPDVVTLVGKVWDLHIKKVLKISLQDNLQLIYDSIKFFKKFNFEVFFDAEHFFDGYIANSKYAVEVLKTAEKAGVDCNVLCDTNGGRLPSQVATIINKVKSEITKEFGIHTHNDSDMAVANSIIAVENGATQIQGTINGYGERCGNANLCSLLPIITFKMGLDTIPRENLKLLTSVSRFVSEIANCLHPNNAPFVGKSAYAHKGGLHINAILKDLQTYEHLNPEFVGNQRRLLVSEQAGKSTVVNFAKQIGISKLSDNKEQTEKILKRLKQLEYQGYQFEGADASFELLIRENTEKYKRAFELEGFKVLVEKRSNDSMYSEATIKIKVDKCSEHMTAEGDGPVNALDNALRKTLLKFYPILNEVHLTDYKVRVLDAKQGTGAGVRVLLQTTDGKKSWGTVGVSTNVIQASWEALVDSLEYKLLEKLKNSSK